jgi:hypothetical protein
MKRLLLFLFLAALLFFPLAAVAEEPPCDPGRILPPCTCDGSCQLGDFVDLFINLYAFGVHIAAPLAVLFIVIGSVILVTASGFSERITLGKTMITQAVVGLIIVLISWVIVDTAIFVITNDSERMVFGKPWFSTRFTYQSCDEDRLYHGCSGSNVTRLQQQLNRLGYALDIDGAYGTQTAAAVQHFQTDVNDRLFVASGVTACGSTPEGIVVWNLVFEKDCNPPSGVCVVPAETAESKKLPTSGAADRATQDALTMISQSTPDEYSTACAT